MKLRGLKVLALLIVASILSVASCTPPVSMGDSQTMVESRANRGAWAAGTTYALNDVVSYNGVAYTCRLGHTAIAGWEPPNVLALWLPGGNIDPVPPAVPAGLTANALSETSIAVSWSSVANADAYDLELDGTIRSLSATSFTHEGLAVDSTHGYRVRARNSVGTSAWSTAVSAKTGKVIEQNLPKHILTGYWQNFNNGAKVLRISEVPLAYNIICVSFADATSVPGKVDFVLDPGLGFSEAQFIADIATVKARGQHVILSVGGQNGSIRVADSASAQNFADSINSLMNKYGFEGVDIDLENGVNAQYMAEALRKVRAGAIITMAPETIGMQSPGAEYFKLALAIKDILTVCNMQYYNSGSMLGQDGKVYSQGGVDFLTALAAIQLENGLRPDQVGLGLPASPSGAGSGYVSPSVIINALDVLVKGSAGGSYKPPRTYPGFRGVMTWSINWDASANWAFSNAIGAKLKEMNGNQPADTVPPSKPANLLASAVGPRSVNLAWSASSDNVGVSSYQVSWNGGSVTVGDTSTVISNLSPASTYTFSVLARDAAGNASPAASNASPAASLTVTTGSDSDSQAPSVPTNVQATSISATSAQIQWTASTDNVPGTLDYLLSWNGGSATVQGTSRVLDGLTASTDYTVTIRARDAAGNTSNAASVSFRTATIDSGASPWEAYKQYAAGTVVSYGGSNWTCRQPHMSLPGWEPPNVGALWLAGGVVNDPLPAVPTALAAAAIDTSSIRVTWAISSGTASCDLEVDGVVREAVTSPFTHSGLAAGSSHTYRVRSRNNAGLSAWSSPASASTDGGVVVIPGVPGGLTARSLGTSSIEVLWTNVSGAASYDLEVDGGIVGNVGSPWTHTSLAAASNHSYRVRARNAAGASAWSNSVSASTQDIPVNGLPKRIMSGYWHTWGGGAGGGVPFVKLRDVSPAWDVINISFAEPVSAGSGDGSMKFVIPGLTADYTVADFKADIRSLQGRGKKIVLSIGGYEGFFSLNSSGAVSTFVNGIKGFINEYGFDGIDIDLEQSSVALNSGADPDFRNPVSAKVVNMISAIRQIVNAYPASFILSWAPETFYLQLGHQFYAGANGYVDARAGCYIPMIHALRDRTTYVQAQLYNSGPIMGNDGVSYTMGSVDGIVAMCTMLLEGFTVNGNASMVFPALRPDQVVIAVPASGSAAGSGQIPNAQLQQAFTTLNNRFPGLRGIMAWSINWDSFQNGNSFATGNRAYLNTLP